MSTCSAELTKKYFLKLFIQVGQGLFPIKIPETGMNDQIGRDVEPDSNGREHALVIKTGVDAFLSPGSLRACHDKFDGTRTIVCNYPGHLVRGALHIIIIYEVGCFYNVK